MSNDIDVRKSSDLSAVDAMLAAKAAALQKNISAAGNHISTKDKKFRLPDGTVVEGVLERAVLAYRFQNRYYDTPYDPENPSPPVCFAISETNKGMKPSPNASKPQAESCDVCPLNEFGSKGKAKACRNTVVMAVMDPDLMTDDVTSITASPIAHRDVAQYLRKASDLYGHFVKVITKFSLEDAPRGFKLEARAGQLNPKYVDHVAFFPQAEALVTAEPEAQEETEDTVTEQKATPSSSGPATRRSNAA